MVSDIINAVHEKKRFPLRQSGLGFPPLPLLPSEVEKVWTLL